MGNFIGKEKMIALGALVESKIGSDKEYIVIVSDKEGKGRCVQYSKNMPMQRSVSRMLEYIANVGNQSIMNIPNEN